VIEFPLDDTVLYSNITIPAPFYIVKPNVGVKGEARTYKRYVDVRSRNHCWHGKAKSIKHSECVSVALVMPHTMRMRRIILPSVASPAVPYFSTLSRKRHDFREKSY
jgi:hypothetical protein